MDEKNNTNIIQNGGTKDNSNNEVIGIVILGIILLIAILIRKGKQNIDKKQNKQGGTYARIKN